MASGTYFFYILLAQAEVIPVALSSTREKIYEFFKRQVSLFLSFPIQGASACDPPLFYSSKKKKCNKFYRKEGNLV
jgi:hypothetical protein